MLEIANQDKEVQRLMTVPGIGPVTALTYKAEIFDAKAGQNVHVRTEGVEIFVSGSRNSHFNPQQEMEPIESLGLKIMKRKGLKKAAFAVGRKLAVIMHRMMIEEKEFMYGEVKVA